MGGSGARLHCMLLSFRLLTGFTQRKRSLFGCQWNVRMNWSRGSVAGAAALMYRAVALGGARGQREWRQRQKEAGS